MPATIHDPTVNSNPATPATAATSDSPSTMMKKVPNRSVRCEMTTERPLSSRQARFGMARSASIATPHTTYRHGLGTKIDRSQSPVVDE